jgi:hypothetical protein
VTGFLRFRRRVARILGEGEFEIVRSAYGRELDGLRYERLLRSARGSPKTTFTGGTPTVVFAGDRSGALPVDLLDARHDHSPSQCAEENDGRGEHESELE